MFGLVGVSFGWVLPMRLRPKNRYSLAILTLLSFLLILGTELHRRAFNVRISKLSKRIDSLSSDIKDLESSASTSSSSSSSSSSSASSLSSQYQHIPPNILGWGRSAGRIYCDVSYGDGTQLRYYCRTNAPRSEVKWFVDRLASDSRLHSYVLIDEKKNDKFSHE